MTDTLASILKPQPFAATSKGDPEQLLQDWRKYVKTFKNFLRVTKAAGAHTEAHAGCEACASSQAMLRMIGGEEVDTLLDHVGKVGEGDKFDDVVAAVEEGITRQTN